MATKVLNLSKYIKTEQLEKKSQKPAADSYNTTMQQGIPKSYKMQLDDTIHANSHKTCMISKSMAEGTRGDGQT